MAAPESEAGVAPAASTLVEAVPVMTELPIACTAYAREFGRLTVVWKLVRLNCEPAVGDAGVMVPVDVALLSTIVPTGVPGQYTSNGCESANAGDTHAVRSAIAPTLTANNPASTTANRLRTNLAMFPPLFRCSRSFL